MRSLETGQHYPLTLDDLPSRWAAVAVGDAVEYINPGFPSGRHNQEGIGVPHLRPMNIDRQGRIDLSVLKYVPANDGVRLRKGDVLFNNTNSAELIGKTAAIARDEDWAFSNHMTRLRPGAGVSAKFMALQLHFLWMTGYFVHRCTHHVNQASISSGVLAETVPFVLAPTHEQELIVAEIEKQFTRLDAAVAALKRVQANLKRYRAAVLKAACEGRLVPTEAELARKEGRSYEIGEQLLSRILKERRAKWEADQLAKMQASGKPPKNNEWKKKYKEAEPPDTRDLPTLPEGWMWASWEQIGFAQNGRPFPSAEYCDGGVKLLRPGNLHVSGRVQWTDENTRCMPKKWESENTDLIVGPSELVMNLTAQSLKDEFLGRICLTSTDEHCLLNQRLARLVPIIVDRRFLLWFLKSSVFRRFVDDLNTGSLIQHMFTSQLAKFMLPLPPFQEQIRIATEIEARLSVLENNETVCEKALKEIEVLRQSILKRAFEGKLVPQDPNDEPASALLERIRTTRSVSGEKRRGQAMRRPRPSTQQKVLVP